MSLISHSQCTVNTYDSTIQDNSLKYQCLNLENLYCSRFVCDSEDLDLEKDISIFEGTPVLCDSELIGFISEGKTLNIRRLSGI